MRDVMNCKYTKYTKTVLEFYSSDQIWSWSCDHNRPVGKQLFMQVHLFTHVVNEGLQVF